MNIDSIKNGLVIDHIKAGKSMDIYHYLNLEKLDCQIAIIKNASSKRMGKKDIIKIDTELDIDVDALGYIDKNITVNFIKNGVKVKKVYPDLPDTITDIIKCSNPRCITSIEQEIHHIFKLTDRENGVYRCIYCESLAKEHNA
ncbi:MAG: aspartate carbamoyltransferase regulatory subunit [Ruminococcaceae bacterium]|nr:aspartate carbamoyltransferase regulatory subunit [Oscillospiraceae bacterium]